MDRRELHALLSADGVRADAFDVLGSDPHPAPGDLYVLRRIQPGALDEPVYWSAYYSERGGQMNLQKFATEDEACRYFYKWVTDDKTTRA